jgi:hypothetical protein
MGMFDFLDGGAGNDISNGYNKASSQMAPYYNAGISGLNQYQDYLNKQGQMLDQYGNPADWQWSHANMSPTDFTNMIMSGYSMSPQAQYQMTQQQNAIDHASSASGMTGSGAYGKALQENANQIVAGDQQQYYNNAMQSMGAQSNAINNFQGQQAAYAQGLNNLANYGYGAAGMMGNWAVGRGNAMGANDRQNMADAEQMASMIAMMFA